MSVDSRAIVVVDEAGMVGTHKLARLLDHAEHAGAKVVLVGDPRQLPEIDAGVGASITRGRRRAAAAMLESQSGLLKGMQRLT